MRLGKLTDKLLRAECKGWKFFKLEGKHGVWMRRGYGTVEVLVYVRVNDVFDLEDDFCVALMNGRVYFLKIGIEAITKSELIRISRFLREAGVDFKIYRNRVTGFCEFDVRLLMSWLDFTKWYEELEKIFVVRVWE